jgi:hypothetical protein
MTPVVPDAAQTERRLSQILQRDSANVGVGASMDRLTVMLTRSCELRCSYCFVAVTDEGHGRDQAGTSKSGVPIGDMAPATLTAAIDLLMRSPRPRLALQLFGGEPTRRWDLLSSAITHAIEHPERRGRSLELLLTTNGLGLDGLVAEQAGRLARLRVPEVVVELSFDGDARGSRFRRGHLLTTADVSASLERQLPALLESGVRFFVNATLPPAAAGEVEERYHWARSLGVPALQLNYATGMAWTSAQVASYLVGLQRVLAHHHADPGKMQLLNWQNGADPVPLCADVIVDVDGSVLQMGGVFHEKRFPALRAAYARGDVRREEAFEGLRIPLGALWELTQGTLEPADWAVFADNVRLGAAVDLVVQFTRRRLGLDAVRTS